MKKKIFILLIGAMLLGCGGNKNSFNVENYKTTPQEIVQKINDDQLKVIDQLDRLAIINENGQLDNVYYDKMLGKEVYAVNPKGEKYQLTDGEYFQKPYNKLIFKVKDKKLVGVYEIKFYRDKVYEIESLRLGKTKEDYLGIEYIENDELYKEVLTKKGTEVIIEESFMEDSDLMISKNRSFMSGNCIFTIIDDISNDKGEKLSENYRKRSANEIIYSFKSIEEYVKELKTIDKVIYGEAYDLFGDLAIITIKDKNNTDYVKAIKIGSNYKNFLFKNNKLVKELSFDYRSRKEKEINYTK